MKNPDMAGLIRCTEEEKNNGVLEQQLTNYAQRKEPEEHKQII